MATCLRAFAHHRGMRLLQGWPRGFALACPLCDVCLSRRQEAGFARARSGFAATCHTLCKGSAGGGKENEFIMVGSAGAV